MTDNGQCEPLAEADVDAVIARYPDRTGDLLNILEDLQEAHPRRFLPRATLSQVAQKTGIARAQIWSVVTFYAFFNLAPQGRHQVCVCRGTACHTRGSKPLYDTLRRAVGAENMGDAEEEETFTTPDHRLTVRTVACFGQCAMAPVVAVDDAMHGHVTDPMLKTLLTQLEEGDRP